MQGKTNSCIVAIINGKSIVSDDMERGIANLLARLLVRYGMATSAEVYSEGKLYWTFGKSEKLR